MKTIVIATDSFKGSASSQEVAENLQRGLTAANPSLKIKKVPLADGGEGTVTAIVNATKGHLISTRVSGPTGSQIDAKWGQIDDQTAVIEMAAAAGYTQGQTTDVAVRSTYGVGELIEAALDHASAKSFWDLVVVQPTMVALAWLRLWVVIFMIETVMRSPVELADSKTWTKLI